MAGDGMHISEYDPSVADAILGEAAHLLRSIGFSARHSILIGGLVPGLLVLDPDRGASLISEPLTWTYVSALPWSRATQPNTTGSRPGYARPGSARPTSICMEAD